MPIKIIAPFQLRCGPKARLVQSEGLYEDDSVFLIFMADFGSWSSLRMLEIFDRRKSKDTRSGTHISSLSSVLCFRPNFMLLSFLFLIGSGLCWADQNVVEPAASRESQAAGYIGIDEVQPGMEAYCLTVYEGTEIEKFDLEVLSVIHNMSPGQDAILVQGTDQRFIHTGPVAGCSGSPVYIDGRLAGALAFGWTFSKDPIYGVTPIEEMLRVGESCPPEGALRTAPGPAGYVFDFSAPVDFGQIYRQLTDVGSAASMPNRLPCPLITSGLPDGVCRQLDKLLEPYGLMVVSGPGGGTVNRVTNHESRVTKLVPGAVLTVPLITGDIEMTVFGTVTEVIGDQVYGFGHSLLGYGAVDLPMATGYVHTVVSSVVRSFKFGSALEIVGALTADEAAAIRGRLGAEARMFPMTIKLDRYNGAQKQIFNCRVADNRVFTPRMLHYAVAGAILSLGSLPPRHTIEYKVSIDVEGAESITFENMSTGRGPEEMISESISSVAMLMNNPYREVDIKSVDFDIRIVARDSRSRIWSVDLSDSKVKPGEKIEVEIVVQSPLTGKKKYKSGFTIPDELEPVKYDLIVCGANGYQNFLKKAAQYKFIPRSLSTLIDAMNFSLRIARDKLYCLLVLPPRGVAVEKAELSDLPATKALVLADAKRTLRVQPYQHWLEDSFRIGTFVADKKVMRITVEKQ